MMEHNVHWGGIAFSLSIFLMITLGAELFPKKLMHLERTWLLNAVWLGMSAYIVAVDGEFAKTPLAMAVIVGAIINSVVFMFARNDSISGMKLKTFGGEVEVNKKGSDEKEKDEQSK